MTLFSISQLVVSGFLLFSIYAVVLFFKKYHLNKKVRSPFTDETLLRLPGHSLNKQIEELSENIDVDIFGIFVFSNFLITAIVLNTIQVGFKKALGINLITGVLILICIAVFLVKIFKRMNLRKQLQLGYEGELITAQELNKIMPEGNHVYHDFPADKFNIDHIVIGPGGIFAVETKARSKQISENNQADAKAIYNGTEIEFPNYKDKAYLDQAKRQAAWLSKWLNSSTGEPVNVFSVISLPGWYVERKTGYDGMFVVNPKNLKSVIQSKNRILTEQKIKQIIHQIDKQCKDIEILSKRYDKKKELSK